MEAIQLFLWRGGRRFGRLYLRDADSPQALSALLVPDDDTAGLESLSQLRHTRFPDAPVTQRLREPDTIAERFVPDRTRAKQSHSTTIRDGQPLGVPLDVQYSIRNEDGQTLPFESIRVLETRPIPGREHETLGDVPRDVLHRGSVWCVFASRVAAV